MADRVGALSMFGNGLKVVAVSLPVMLPILVLNGLVFGWLDHSTGSIVEACKADPGQAEVAGQVSAGIAGLLGLYLLIQIPKRKTASWASWIPTLFLPSAVLIAGWGLWFEQLAKHQELMLTLLLRLPIELAWTCTIGGVMYGLWVCLSYNVATTGRANLGGAVSRLSQAGLGFIAPHGGAILLIFLGMQIVLPGVFYAVLFAFVTHAAILNPEVSPFRHSTETSQGFRRPIIILFLLTLVPAFFGRFFITVWAESLFAQWGLAEAFVVNGAFDSGKAWGNAVAMILGAPWAGAFYSESVAMVFMGLLGGVGASGLTWGYLALNKAPEPNDVSVESA